MGIEPSTETTENMAILERRDADSGAVGGEMPHDGDLERVIAAWPMLPDTTRRTILELIDADAERV